MEDSEVQLCGHCLRECWGMGLVLSQSMQKIRVICKSGSGGCPSHPRSPRVWGSIQCRWLKFSRNAADTGGFLYRSSGGFAVSCSKCIREASPMVQSRKLSTHRSIGIRFRLCRSPGSGYAANERSSLAFSKGGALRPAWPCPF